MKNYSIRVIGAISDPETNFSMSVNLAVQNGGSLEDIGKALQGAVDDLSSKSVVPAKEPEEQK